MSSTFTFVTTMKSSNKLIPCFNFSPIFDMITGEYVTGHDGVTYLNGGLTANNAIVGGNNTQKTGYVVLGMARMLIRFPMCVVIMFDIEKTFSVARLARMVDEEIGIPGYFEEHIFNKRFFYHSGADGVDGTFIHNWFKDTHAAIKQDLKDKKPIKIKTVYKDNDGNPLEVIVPIVTVTDSISELASTKIAKEFQEGDVDQGGAKKTRDMAYGNHRRIVYEDADMLGGECGMIQMWTAQVVDVINMTGQPQEKESVFIRPGKKLKAPRSLLRRPPVGIEIIKGSALKEGQEWKYPNPFGGDVVIDKDAKENPDLLFYTTTTFRNKNGGSGGANAFIGSQSLGIQEGLTMYHVIKEHDYWGLDGSKISHACTLYPECKVGRTTIRAKLNDDKKLFRALTICYQMWYMQSRWLHLDPKYRITPQELYEKITAQGYDWNDMLDTVDYWHLNPDIKQPTLSTMELLKIALGERKPHWHSKTK